MIIILLYSKKPSKTWYKVIKIKLKPEYTNLQHHKIQLERIINSINGKFLTLAKICKKKSEDVSI